MQLLQQTDKGEIKSYSVREDGSLICWLRVSAANRELDYGAGNKQRIDAKTLFDEKALDTLVGAPITFHHPPSFILTTDDRLQHGKGSILQEIKQEDVDGETYLTVAAVVEDSKTISEIIAGNCEVSPGYWCLKDGEGNQVYRRYNHVAIVPKGHGRNGGDVKVLMDSLDNEMPEEKTTEPELEVVETTEETSDPEVSTSDTETAEIVAPTLGESGSDLSAVSFALRYGDELKKAGIDLVDWLTQGKSLVEAKYQILVQMAKAEGVTLEVADSLQTNQDAVNLGLEVATKFRSAVLKAQADAANQIEAATAKVPKPLRTANEDSQNTAASARSSYITEALKV